LLMVMMGYVRGVEWMLTSDNSLRHWNGI